MYVRTYILYTDYVCMYHDVCMHTIFMQHYGTAQSQGIECSRVANKWLVSNSRVIHVRLLSNSWATLEQHACDSCVRHAGVCEWLAIKRWLAGKMLHWQVRMEWIENVEWLVTKKVSNVANCERDHYSKNGTKFTMLVYCAFPIKCLKAKVSFTVTVPLSYNFKHTWYHTCRKLRVSSCNRGFSFYTKPRLH